MSSSDPQRNCDPRGGPLQSRHDGSANRLHASEGTIFRSQQDTAHEQGQTTGLHPGSSTEGTGIKEEVMSRQMGDGSSKNTSELLDRLTRQGFDPSAMSSQYQQQPQHQHRQFNGNNRSHPHWNHQKNEPRDHQHNSTSGQSAHRYGNPGTNQYGCAQPQPYSYSHPPPGPGPPPMALHPDRSYVQGVNAPHEQSQTGIYSSDPWPQQRAVGESSYRTYIAQGEDRRQEQSRYQDYRSMPSQQQAGMSPPQRSSPPSRPESTRRSERTDGNDRELHTSRKRSRSRSRSPLPSSMQQVTLVGVSSTMRPEALDTMLRNFCQERSSDDLEPPTDTSIRGNGRAIVTFQKFAYAKRFVDACGPEGEIRTQDIKRLLGDVKEEVGGMKALQGCHLDTESGEVTGNVDPQADQRQQSTSSNPEEKKKKGLHEDIKGSVSSSQPSNSHKPPKPSGFKTANKTVAANIARWTKKQGELHGEHDHKEVKEADVKPPSNDSVSRKDTDREDISRFSDKEAICCYLCNRKFKSVDILEKHEKQSNLHSSNLQNEEKCKNGMEMLQKKRDEQRLVKAEDQDHSVNTAEEVKYRDRASERRSIFGSSNSSNDPHQAVKKAKVQKSFNGPLPSDAVQKSYNGLLPSVSSSSGGEGVLEDPTNIGNRLLASMGWVQGQGIGQHGIEKAIEVSSYSNGAGIGSRQNKEDNYSAGANAGGNGSMIDQARQQRFSRYHQSQSQ
ncbi:unnamed protein product [Sympodiomycopsis kandeliae]